MLPACGWLTRIPLRHQFLKPEPVLGQLLHQSDPGGHARRLQLVRIRIEEISQLLAALSHFANASLERIGIDRHGGVPAGSDNQSAAIE